jgi:hypothetical protein
LDGQRLRLSRRAAFGALVALSVARRALGFGQDGAFHPRLLRTGSALPSDSHRSGTARWSWELIRRTSAPARLSASDVAADDSALLDEPFTVWIGAGPLAPLSEPEIRGLRRYLALGGVLFVDDSNPATGEFGKSAKLELQRVLPESPSIRLPSQHVLYKSYYLIDRPVGRVEGPAYLEAILSGKELRVLFSAQDLLGALARSPDEGWTFAVDMDQREQAIRLAVNLAMYVLCLDYKDDQVHAEELMRRRGRQR